MTMRKEAIIVDVDLTVVDSGWPWLYWMEAVYNTTADYDRMAIDRELHGLLNYNLSAYFPNRCTQALSPYEYFEDPHLYDKLLPLPGVVDAIYRLWKAGHPIRFVSYCKKGHFSSKVRFLKRHFPFIDLDSGACGSGFYATKNKAGVSGRYVIDDRHEFLNQFPDDVLKIKFKTQYTQSEEPKVVYDLVSNNWERIADFILDEEVEAV